MGKHSGWKPQGKPPLTAQAPITQDAVRADEEYTGSPSMSAPQVDEAVTESAYPDPQSAFLAACDLVARGADIKDGIAVITSYYESVSVQTEASLQADVRAVDLYVARCRHSLDSLLAAFYSTVRARMQMISPE